MFLETAAKWHLAAAKGEKKSPDTLEAYANVHRQFIAFLSASLGRPPTIADLTLEHARLWQGVLADRALSGTTMYHYTRFLKVWSRWLANEFGAELPDVFAGGDPLAKLKCPRRDEKEPSVLDRDQIELLVTFCQTTRDPLRNKAMILLLAESGLRNHEVCGLQLTQPVYATSKDNPGHMIVFGKGRKERAVGFGLRASKAMQHYIADERRAHDTHGSPFIFLSHYGDPITPSALRHLCVTLRKKTGIVTERIHPHALRHSFANMRAEAGLSVNAIRLQLGHQTSRQTERYIRRAQTDITKHYMSMMDTPPKRKEPRS